MSSQQSKHEQAAGSWIIITLCAVVAIIIGVMAYMQFFVQDNNSANSFQSCRDAGGGIAERNPEQCTIDGRTFTDDSTDVEDTTVTPDEDTDASAMTDTQISETYVGLSEDGAFARANAEDRRARVIERNGQSLKRTSDLADGRLNFTIRDGIVEKVVVEHVRMSE